jgi:hypothetical protein
MEGSPELEVVFGDAESYRRHVNRFYELQAAMDEARGNFTRDVQAALVAASRATGKCPSELLAPLYFGAHRDGETYRKLGAQFEEEYGAISNLHRLGETAGLTPNYRWKVSQIATLYADTLVDYKEMRIAFFDQLAGELQARGCSIAKLLEDGEKAARPDVEALVTAVPLDTPRKPPRNRGEPAPIVQASTVTFFVDNTGCAEALRVYVDGTLLGEVDAQSKTAFQALAGRHMLCLIESDSTAQCGDPSTVRESYIHDRWSIRMQCGK